MVSVAVVLGCFPSGLNAQRRQRDEEGGERQRERNLVQRDRDGRLISPHLLPPRPDPNRRWYLGVEVEYRDYGAQITRVVQRSPASRAGLEPRDVIVTVGGYQVGRIDNRLYPLDRELEFRADARGRVTFLVQNHRNSQLTPLPVRLEPAERRRDPIDSRQLIGTVDSRRTTSLPANASLEIRLLDVTSRRVPAAVVARRTYRNLGPLPIPFELEYSESDIKAGRKYALEATVTMNGFVAYRSTERKSVLTGQPQGRINIEIEPARR
jgi:putative lipoprotein